MNLVDVRINPKEEVGKLSKLRNMSGSLEVTVKGYLVSDKKYSKWTGDAYELAEIHTYGLNVPKRPFMYNAKKYINEHKTVRAELARKINKNKRLSSTGKSFWVDWTEAGEFLVDKVQKLLKSGRLDLMPLASSTLYRRDLAGYGNKPLFASGGLADCIVWQEV